MRVLKTLAILFLLQLQLLGFVMRITPTFAQVVPEPPGNTSQSQETKSQASPQIPPECSTVLSPPGGPVSLSPEQAKGDIYAFMGESIDRRFPKTDAKWNYTCNDIAQCLRATYSLSPARETLIINDLKSTYAYCLVTGSDGLGLLSNYAKTVYQWIAGIAGGICILTIVVSGLQYSIGGVDQESAGAAKDRIIRALSGLVILFLSAFILYSINPIFFQ